MTKNITLEKQGEKFYLHFDSNALAFGKKTGKMLLDYEDREDNAISDTNVSGSYISAALLYRRNIGASGAEGFKKSVILNKSAKYPLNSNEYKKLNRFNLSNLETKK